MDVLREAYERDGFVRIEGVFAPAEQSAIRTIGRSCK